eukprot:gene33382-40385_t
MVKQPGHADAYHNLKVTFIAGRNPDLFIRDDDGHEIEKIDLSNMSTDQIHDLLVAKGFERRALAQVVEEDAEEEQDNAAPHDDEF